MARIMPESIGGQTNPSILWNKNLHALLFALLFFIQPSQQQQFNILTEFCRRFGHQTAVVDRKLYIDGGMVDFTPTPITQNYSNSWLAFNDLNSNPAPNFQPQLYANLSKNASIPEVSGGVLWADDVNKRFYLYGGEYATEVQNAYSLYSYDTLYNQWENFGPPSSSISSVSYGAGVGISELGQGYYLGGWLSNLTVPGWDGPPLATNSLIKYDYDLQAWTNNTGPGSNGFAEGAMVYIPASVSGLLVYFGGVTVNGSGVEEPLGMDQIFIYDIQSSKWYNETAYGDVPSDRRRFCAGATWAKDQSSYNIYLYGGLGFGANYSGYDDVYILSLPSFTWIQWWPTTPGQADPHHSLTCNVVGGSNVIGGGQMLIIGGTFPKSTTICDSQSTWGTHNLNLGKQNVEDAMWYDYLPNITSYSVPSEIISVVGGGSSGGATLKAPTEGFRSPDMTVYFRENATAGVRTATRAVPTGTSTPTPGSGSSLSTGAIVGISVGGAAFLLILAFAGFCCVRRHRRKNRLSMVPAPAYSEAPQDSPSRANGEFDPNKPLYSPNSMAQYAEMPSSPTGPVELENTEGTYGQFRMDPNYHHKQISNPANWIGQGSPPQQFSPVSQHTTLRDSTLTESSAMGNAYEPEASPTPTYASTMHRQSPSTVIPPNNQRHYSHNSS